MAQKQIGLPKNKQLQVQDRLQQLVNDTSARYFGEIEAIVGVYFKGYNPLYAHAYAGYDQDINKRVQNIEMANLILTIQTGEASNDPNLPPIRVAAIPQAHLEQTYNLAAQIPDKQLSHFLLSHFSTFGHSMPANPHPQQQQTPIYPVPPQALLPDHGDAHNQRQLLATCNQTHDLGDHISKRLLDELPQDDSRYLVPATPLISMSEARGIVNSHMLPEQTHQTGSIATNTTVHVVIPTTQSVVGENANVECTADHQCPAKPQQAEPHPEAQQGEQHPPQKARPTDTPRAYRPLCPRGKVTKPAV